MVHKDVKIVVNAFLQKIDLLNAEDKGKAVAQFKEEVLPWLAGIMAEEASADLGSNEDPDKALEVLRNLYRLADEQLNEYAELVDCAIEEGDYTGAIQAVGMHQSCRAMKQEIREALDSVLFQEGGDPGEG